MQKLFLFTILLSSIFPVSSDILQGSQCCSQCNISVFSSGSQIPERMLDILVTAISRNWNSSYLVSKLQQFPTAYFRELVNSISSVDNMVKNGSSACGGESLTSYPNEYLPSQIIQTLYDSIAQSFALNLIRLDPNYVQAMIALVNSLKTQFTNGYGIQADPSSNDTFTYYHDDPTNLTTGNVFSSALASGLASSIVNSADPMILTAINYYYFDQANIKFGDLPYVIALSNRDIIQKIGSASNFIQLDFPKLYNSRVPPFGLKTFRISVDSTNGNPFGLAAMDRLGGIDLSIISSASDPVKAKLMSSLLSGYAYCYFPNLVNALQNSCMSSCSLAC